LHGECVVELQTLEKGKRSVVVQPARYTNSSKIIIGEVSDITFFASSDLIMSKAIKIENGAIIESNIEAVISNLHYPAWKPWHISNYRENVY